jgi:hypothetical protein
MPFLEHAEDRPIRAAVTGTGSCDSSPRYLVLARVVIPNYVTGIELFADGGMAQV